MVAAQASSGAQIGMNVAAKVAVIVPAGGSGRRFGGQENKLFASLAGKPVWIHTLERLRAHRRVAEIVMAVSNEDRNRFESEFIEDLNRLSIQLVEGGKERTESVQSGVDFLADESGHILVAIHDAARPLIRRRDLDAVFERADKTGAAILASPVAATVKQSFDQGDSCSTVDRSTLWLAQTPQVFRLDLLRRAYGKHRGRPATDDAELVSRLGIDVALVRGSDDNFKITHPGDLNMAAAILQSQTEQ